MVSGEGLLTSCP